MQALFSRLTYTDIGVPLDPIGNYADKYVSLPMGWYKVLAAARDNANNVSSQMSPELKIGNPPPLVAYVSMTLKTPTLGMYRKDALLSAALVLPARRGRTKILVYSMWLLRLASLKKIRATSEKVFVPYSDKHFRTRIRGWCRLNLIAGAPPGAPGGTPHCLASGFSEV